MNCEDILSCIKTLKPKNCEGFDRIPMRIICDAKDYLLPPITELFRLIYQQKVIPDQWKIAKVIPVF
jgi:hypothetical protein